MRIGMTVGPDRARYATKVERLRAAAQWARNKPKLYEWVRSPDGHNHPHDFEHPGFDYVEGELKDERSR